jgi:hypothetical protein
MRTSVDADVHRQCRALNEGLAALLVRAFEGPLVEMDAVVPRQGKGVELASLMRAYAKGCAEADLGRDDAERRSVSDAGSVEDKDP